MQDAARTYLRLVIHEEWSLMARGASSTRAHAALVELWTVYTDMEAKQRASPLYDRSVTRLNELGDNRRQRLNDAGQSVSPLMWVMLYLGSVLTVVTLCLFDANSHRLHLFLTMTLAGHADARADPDRGAAPFPVFRTRREWLDLLQGLYTSWGGRWFRPPG
ncbi:hypothetical protein GCM10020220_053910 [Nonomuraea rubra]